jgi:hypothetical protein
VSTKVLANWNAVGSARRAAALVTLRKGLERFSLLGERGRPIIAILRGAGRNARFIWKTSCARPSSLLLDRPISRYLDCALPKCQYWCVCRGLSKKTRGVLVPTNRPRPLRSLRFGEIFGK